jgi:hypothetical protein
MKRKEGISVLRGFSQQDKNIIEKIEDLIYIRGMLHYLYC